MGTVMRAYTDVVMGGVCCRAAATAEYVSREVIYNEVDLVLHVGDISYANGDPEVRPPIPLRCLPLFLCTRWFCPICLALSFQAWLSLLSGQPAPAYICQ